MGLLDSIKGMLGKSGGGKDVMSQLAGMLTGKGGDGLGLERLLEQFKGAGLGDKADSWVGTGENQPLTPDEVRRPSATTGWPRCRSRPVRASAHDRPVEDDPRRREQAHAGRQGPRRATS